MVDKMSDITMVQVEAGEAAVVQRLRQKGLLPPDNEDGGVYPSSSEILVAIDQRQRLEHSLATTFVELQRERDPLQRQAKWMECLRLSKELEKLSNEPNKM